MGLRQVCITVLSTPETTNRLGSKMFFPKPCIPWSSSIQRSSLPLCLFVDFVQRDSTRCRPRWENPDRRKVIGASMNPHLILPAVQETMPVRLDKAGQQRNLASIRGVNAVGSPIPPVGGKDSCVRQRNPGCRAGLDSISTSVE